MTKLILGSGSPRRKEIMEQVGLEFTIRVSDKEEVITTDDPKQAVLQLASQKAEDIADRINEEAIVIGADTVVVNAGRILGKPEDREHAKKMLKELSGSIHSVVTGVCILSKKSGAIVDNISFYEETQVEMYSLAESEIEEYLLSGEGDDKAGAYGIQGKAAPFIRRIQGDYYNVVGFPIARVMRELKKIQEQEQTRCRNK